MEIDRLKRLADVVTRRWKISGIEDFSANPLTGTVTIKYAPDAMDILAYLKTIAADEEVNQIIRKGAFHEVHRVFS